MPDISLCKDENCISRKHCYRFMAKPNPLWQAYTDFNRPKSEAKCEEYMLLFVGDDDHGHDDRIL